LPCDVCHQKIWGKDTAVKTDGVLQHRKCQEASKPDKDKLLSAPSNLMRPSALIKDHKAKMKKIQAANDKKDGPRASYMLRAQISGMKKTHTETGMENKIKDAPDSDLAAKLKKRAEETLAKEKEDQRIREEKEKDKEKEVIPEKPQEIKDGKDAEGYPSPWPKTGMTCELCHTKIWGRDTATMGDNNAVIHAKCKGADSSQLRKADDIAAKINARQVGEQMAVYTFREKGNAADIWQLIGAFDLHWIGLEPTVDDISKTRTVTMPIDENLTIQVQEKESERNNEEFWYTYTYPLPPPGLEYLKNGGVARMSLTQEGEDVKFEWRVTFQGTKAQANELTTTLSSAEPAVADAYKASSEEEVEPTTEIPAAEDAYKASSEVEPTTEIPANSNQAETVEN